MPSQRLIQVGTRYTPEQWEIIKQYAAERGLEYPRDILRSLAKDYFTSQGISWPDEPIQWGGYRGGRKSIE